MFSKPNSGIHKAAHTFGYWITDVHVELSSQCCYDEPYHSIITPAICYMHRTTLNRYTLIDIRQWLYAIDKSSSCAVDSCITSVLVSIIKIAE